MADTKNLWQRIAAAQQEIGWVKKDGVNTAQNYNYATESGLVDSIKKVLTKHGIAVTVSCIGEPINYDVRKAGSSSFITRIHLQCKLINTDNPTEVEVSEWWGDGMDSGDKGIYKAITGAEKYFLMKSFLIPTGDDPEAGNGEPEEPKPAPKPKPSKSMVETARDLYARCDSFDKVRAADEWMEPRKSKLNDADALVILNFRQQKINELDALSPNDPNTIPF